MAAIDKLYVRSYYEYDDLRRWAIAYYPELLFYFYRIDLSYKEWENNLQTFIEEQIRISEREYNKICTKDKVEAVRNLIKYYKEIADYNCLLKQAKKEVDYIITAYNRTPTDWGKLYTTTIMNTPLSIDKKLKWICPVPCVREYLKKNCGIKTKWYHKIFWKGKKYF